MNVWIAINGPRVLLLLLLSSGILLPAAGADNLGTLRTYQRAGCDDNVVTLRCPPGTSISIELAQYGNSGPSKALCGAAASTEASVAAEAGAGAPKDTVNVSCLLSNAMQYSLLQTVVETCQKKPQCKFQTSPKTFGGDPCPGVRKYVEVAYKCRPYEFRSKIACENEKIQLKCNPNARVAVYSASYGRTEYESIQCPQTQGVSEETCLVSYATETVMQICHGKRSCELSADASTFGNPCQPKSRMYLKVVYTCVPRKVLKEQYEGRLEPDELQSEFNAYDDDFDYEHYDTAGNEFIRESAASPPASPPASPNERNEATSGGSPGGNNLTRDSSVSSAKLPPHTKSKDAEKASRHTTLSPPAAPRHHHHSPTTILHHHHHDHHRTSPTAPSRITNDAGAGAGAGANASDGLAPPSAPAQQPDLGMTHLLADPNCTVTVYVTEHVTERARVIGFISNWIHTYTFLSQNRERLYLYLIVSVGSGVLLCLMLLVVRLLVQRHRDKRDAKFHVTNITDNTLPNGFADDISEVDADIDLTTPLPVGVMAVGVMGVGVHSPTSTSAHATMGTISESVRRSYHLHHLHHQQQHHQHQLEQAPTRPPLAPLAAGPGHQYAYYG